MKYYVVSDVHSYYDELIESLTNAGYFDEKENHKLIICGDLFDRGPKAKELQTFIMKLIQNDKVILIRGNHEDLIEKLINEWHLESYMKSHHITNKTLDTVFQLTNTTSKELFYYSDNVVRMLLKTSFVQYILPNMIDYYETKNYIFVHGWIPVINGYYGYEYNKDWRSASKYEWNQARWINGMEAANLGVVEPNKTIICGHYHTSYGHSRILKKCSEFDEDAIFDPYYNQGIIAIDACTPISHKINCIILEENEE